MVFYIIFYLFCTISGLILMKKGLLGVNFNGLSGLVN